MPESKANADKADSKLRLITGEAVVFDAAPDPSDDSPTIISKKNSPSAISESIVGSIRGRRLLHYELIEPIGVGGMAAVIRARDTQLDRFVALKILPPDMAKDPENILRFHQEARAAAKLDHENIARVFNYGEDQGLHFIAFEFVDGQNLRTILERRGRIPVRESIRYVVQIAAGLEHASARGVVHRDVKPSNIIIMPDGRAKLVDMGLARSMEKHSQQQLTQSGVTLGTFDYISPEQALEPRDADGRSDIYSLGCTLYHMLTGHPPVPEGTAAKKLHHHQHVLPLDPRQHTPDIPDEVAMVLGKMMAKDPKDRYQRPVELVQHLMKVAHKVGAADDLPEGVLFVDAHLPGEPNRRPLLILSLAALALAAVLVVLSMAPPRTTKGRTPPEQEAKGAVPKKVDDVPPPPPMQPLNMPPGDLTAAQLFASDMLPADVDLAQQELSVEDPGVVYKGVSREVVKNGSIRFERKELKQERVAVAGLTIEDGTIVFRDMKFDMDSFRKTPKFPAAGIHIKGASNVKFERCEFTQSRFTPRSVRDDRTIHLVASVSVEGDASSGKIPSVLFDRCFFDDGQVAVALYGPADVSAVQCCFKPHYSLFQHRKTGESRIKLENCSAFVMHGPAFRFDDEVACHLTVSSSVFSCPVRQGADEPDFIYQTTSNASEKIVYDGKQNRYHNLNNLLSSRRPDQRNIASYDLFLKTIEKAEGKDEDSLVLAPEATPWKIASSPQTYDKDKAFQLQPEISEYVGAQYCSWGKVTQGIKIVDVGDLNPDNRSTFETLEVALHASKPGDVILIKAGKGAKFGPEREVRADIYKAKLNVTIRPYPGEYPVLVMARPSRRAAQLTLGDDCFVTLEKMEIVLEQDHQDGMPAGVAQSVVSLDGNAKCIFDGCQITLRGKEGALMPGLTVVSFGTTSTSRTPAEVTFRETVIRGDGDIIRQKQHRPVDIKFENTMVALNGSILNFQAQTRDTGKEPVTRITANGSSFFLRKPLLQLHTQPGAATHPLWSWRGDKNRFVSLDSATWPLVHIDAGEVTKDNAASLLDWAGTKNRYFLHTDRMLGARMEPAMGFELTGKQWSEVFEMDKEPGFHNVDLTEYRTLSDWTLRDDFEPHLFQLLGDEPK